MTNEAQRLDAAQQIQALFLLDAVIQKLGRDGFRLVIVPADRDPEQPRWAVAYEPNEGTEGSDYLPGLGFVMPEATIAVGDTFEDALRELARALGVTA